MAHKYKVGDIVLTRYFWNEKHPDGVTEVSATIEYIFARSHLNLTIIASNGEEYCWAVSDYHLKPFVPEHKNIRDKISYELLNRSA